MLARVLVTSLMLVATSAYADTESTMSLTGMATTRATPDVAYISASVVTKNMNAQTSLDLNSTLMGRVYEALENEGVSRKDIQTSNFSFYKVYRREATGKSPNNYKQVFDGYQTSNNIRVTVCDFDSLGKIITSLVDAGVTQLDDVVFGSTREKELLEEARTLAMQDAIKKAKIYADAGNFRLVRIITVSENFQESVLKRAYSRLPAADTTVTPISGGSLNYSITVNVVWEIGPVLGKQETARIKLENKK